ncbi:MAG: formylglycine-generating enzyme family protein [Treponema sp.]|nr:formylglycine-generating enzyme family protein [Treponema sp.]MCL2245457.1 formylglycine-generating enzyme family protein [Treponema sp.]
MKNIFLLMMICIIISGCSDVQSGKMIRINGGTFTMGSPDNETDREYDEGRRNITVKSFYMGEHEVTQKLYQKVMRENNSTFRGAGLPVETVSWYSAVLFCNKLSRLEGLTPVYEADGTNVVWNKEADGYRLPTEAEWEYACRAGVEAAFNTGGNITTAQANYNGDYPYGDNQQGLNLEMTVSPGNYPPNPWGLYDMHGNVFEWCWDWYEIYQRVNLSNPSGPESGSYRVIRGGSWANGANAIRSSYRGIYIAGDGNDRIGFRLARNAR